MAKNFQDPARREVARQVALDFAKHFPGVFVTCGTLLGIVRNDDVIPHDSDVDFGCLAWPFKPIPRQIGPFTRQRYFHHKGRVSEVTFTHSRGIKVDLFLFMDDPPYRFFVAWPDEFPKRPTIIRRFPAEWFDTLEEITAFGGTLCSISQPEQFLEANYGAAWKQPDPKWDYRRRPQPPLDGFLSEVAGG